MYIEYVPSQYTLQAKVISHITMEYEAYPDYRALEYHQQEYEAWEKEQSPLQKLIRLVEESKAIREKGIYGFLKK